MDAVQHAYSHHLQNNHYKTQRVKFLNQLGNTWIEPSEYCVLEDTTDSSDDLDSIQDPHFNENENSLNWLTHFFNSLLYVHHFEDNKHKYGYSFEPTSISTHPIYILNQVFRI